MTTMPDPGDMLALRRWALHVFARGPDDVAAAARDAAARCSAASWRMFLRLEHCAVPLQRELASAGRPDSPPRAGGDALREVAVRETRRVLSARAQLQTLAGIARTEGWPLVVLKGGVPAASGGPMLDLSDVDVLAPPGMADAVARRLDDEGFSAHGLPPSHHLPPRTLPGAIPVEVHRHLKEIEGLDEMRRRILPLEAMPGLWSLHPADHLWYLLVHSVVQHPERRGRIRDVLLLRHAIERASDGMIVAVRARAREHPVAPEALVGTLEMAVALDRGELDDRWGERQLMAYVLAARVGGLASRHLLWSRALTMTQRRLARRESALSVLRTALSAPTRSRHWFGPIAWLSNRWRAGGRALHQFARVAIFATGIVLEVVAKLDFARWRRTLRRRGGVYDPGPVRRALPAPAEVGR